MKRIINLLTICFIANLTFAQNVDESGNVTDSYQKKSKNESFQKLKSIKSNNPVIIKSIPSPTTSTNDIAFDGMCLWQASNDSLIYKISLLDGSVLKTIPINTNYASGLSFDGNSLWVSDRTNQLLLQIDTSNGIVQQQFQLNNDGAAGLAWDNSNLWLNNNKYGGSYGDTTFNISSTSGEILDYFLPHGSQPGGLAFDGQYLWSTDRLSDQIYRIDLSSYSVIDTIDAPGGDHPNGLAFDGQYLWVADNDLDSIYQIDIGFIPDGISDRPISSNRISVYPNPSSGSFIFRV